MPTWDDVVAIAKRFPEVEETTSWQTPSLKVKGRFFARLRTEAEGGLAIVCEPSEKAALLASADPAFYTTPHYDRAAMILVDLARIDEQRLTELIEDAWHRKAPIRVRRAYEAR
ncbi:MmcQ/YjbR family DNA-binding protein [Glycomyces sp. TRM65418]|uniref:MmcQ/YjbR family DNA-binding protein n=1 Tax=Glycomyces sp. TRM65418 TaxID=2867006 RepID=UPI001CE7139C|nr:MmcQ/YjbR family DNA-binding protein [Glycomyces sp. TRM65418]MCC3764997.1 MmcQ/YjbR family DNA-binding protein [Glycomyces sp. TRM65418]QZD54629.1 MmcQ/YjbR family DNA-binding protein [Glycomyces sp. TRM65418]